jgi:hypothetical protein
MGVILQRQVVLIKNERKNPKGCGEAKTTDILFSFCSELKERGPFFYLQMCLSKYFPPKACTSFPETKDWKWEKSFPILNSHIT